ncbi:MAG: hypothetical protein AUG49_24170 [Catenulispora sp. 13_1_20CM_3_70_7]|nr:MAG: hypothetical protein AUG49_24170 [Catenulispora sp. 13_1_20CM_3_70_7]
MTTFPFRRGVPSSIAASCASRLIAEILQGRGRARAAPRFASQAEEDATRYRAYAGGSILQGKTARLEQLAAVGVTDAAESMA